MLGTVLKDRYRVDARLGEGGMGVVYRAYDTLLDRSVTLKTLSPHLPPACGAMPREWPPCAQCQDLYPMVCNARWRCSPLSS